MWINSVVKLRLANANEVWSKFYYGVNKKASIAGSFEALTFQRFLFKFRWVLSSPQPRPGQMLGSHKKANIDFPLETSELSLF